MVDGIIRKESVNPFSIARDGTFLHEGDHG
jgi:hypothetical protein